MSFWLRDERKWRSSCDDLNLQLDDIHDVVIIGGGISGLSVAYHLSLHGIRCTVVEKDGLSAGATGCNGGFLTPGTSEKYSESVARLGPATTRKLFDYTLQCTRAMQDFLQMRNIDCELRFNGCVSLALTEEELLGLRASYEELSAYEVPVEWWDAAKCEERTKSCSFLGGLFKPFAGNLWPAKLVFGLAEAAAQSNVVHIHTHTEVVRVISASASSESSVRRLGEERGLLIGVETSRGTLRARRVVYACNAWTRHLVPELRDVIVPVRNQVIMTRPLPPLWPFGLGANYGYEYFMQRPDGRILLGGMRNLNASQEYNSDDSSTLDPIVSAALRAYLPKHFGSAVIGAREGGDNDQGDAIGQQDEEVDVESEWVGVMGFTPDRCPLIGPLPAHSRPNEFILAGYTGHGMPIAFLAGRDVADMIRGVEPSATFVHEAFDPGRFLQNERRDLSGCHENRYIAAKVDRVEIL